MPNELTPAQKKARKNATKIKREKIKKQKEKEKSKYERNLSFPLSESTFDKNTV